MFVLMVLGVLHAASADKNTKESLGPVTKNIEICLDFGYYYVKGECYLCFCKTNNTGTCWPREKKTCDMNMRARWDKTQSRHLWQLNNMYLRNAAKKSKGAKLGKQCIPYKEGYSEGCPADDWCEGCSVCECNANGFWNCHVMKYCPYGTSTNSKVKKTYKSKVKKYSNIQKVEKINLHLKNANKTNKKDKTTAWKTKQYLHKKVNKTSTFKKKGYSKNVNKQKKQSIKNIKQTNKRVKSQNSRTNNKYINTNRTGKFSKNNVKITNKTIVLAKFNKILSAMQTLLNNNEVTDELAQNSTLMKILKKRSIQKNIWDDPTTNNDISELKLKATNLEKLKRSLRDCLERKKRNTDLGNLSKNKVVKNNIDISAYPQKKETNITTIYTITNSFNKATEKSDYYKYSIYPNIKNITVFVTSGNTTSLKILKIINTTISESANQSSLFLSLLNNPYTDKPKMNIFDKNKTGVVDFRKVTSKKNLPSEIKFQKLQEIKPLYKSLMHENSVSETNKKRNNKGFRETFDNLINRLFLKKPNDAKESNGFKYLRQIFNKIFSGQKQNQRINKKALSTVCKSYGPCKIDKNSKTLLKSKLKYLKAQTNKILTTVNIIRGLLKLMNYNNTISNNTNKIYNNNSLTEDLKILTSIMKGTYLDNQNCTETEATQISYIKSNLDQFTISVGKFASTLSKIIEILTKNDINDKPTTKILNSKSDKQKSLKQYNNLEPYNRLKKLLIKYNLVQNTFLKKIYEGLSKIEKNKPSVNKFTKVENNSNNLNNYTKNIINNLRMLKILAQNVETKRNKREIKDENAIEYLLTLMEYLLKRHQMVSKAPVNDGIDLLIEAIKQAPKIKPIDNIISQYPNLKNKAKKILRPGQLREEYDIIKSNENNSERLLAQFKAVSDLENDSENLSKDSISNKQTTRLEKVTLNEDINDKFDDMMLDSTKFTAKTTMHTTDNIRLFDFEKNEFNVKNSNKILDDEFNSIKTEKPEAVNEKATTKENVKKYEIFSEDLDEEVLYTFNEKHVTTETTKPSSDLSWLLSSTDMPVSTVSTDNSKAPNNLNSFTKSPEEKEHYYNNKTQLEWLDDTYEQDTKEQWIDKKNESMILITETPSTERAKQTKTKENVSSITKELFDDQNDISDDVIYKKQMDLLNSLDYGTEKAELDESESKDGYQRDVRDSDGFPSYF